MKHLRTYHDNTMVAFIIFQHTEMRYMVHKRQIWCKDQISTKEVSVVISLSQPSRYLLSIYYCDVIMGTMASQITSLTIVYSTVHSGADQRKHQSSALLAFVRGIHRWPVNSPHKWPVMRKMFPFDDVIMILPFCPCTSFYQCCNYTG